ncbi:uncharacterized protein LOC113862873 isoform X2 [Abrus precatorius]|uniref:Uncharacterized protein LOC113862873 isoform X2 n=1 Tax=Abrus precatorius TaxID=3816 RepID=A0A8B8LB19_ABRPR|nr:uncharacterized protein LOC113862873 isoform X2 [Abrus precatorius]
MALLPSSLRTLSHISSQLYLTSFHNPIILAPPSSFNPLIHSKQHQNHRSSNSKLLAISYRYFTEQEEDDDDDDEEHNFDEAVTLFNGGEYYKCHDYLEVLWNSAEEPARTLIHGILQCSVGFHHLFNQNHKGAMMELGEGLCKLRKMEFSNGPFQKFEKEISAVLDFIYQTQIELAAWKRVYDLELGLDASVYIVFCPQGSKSNHATEAPRVKLPKLKATMEHLIAYEYK